MTERFAGKKLKAVRSAIEARLYQLDYEYDELHELNRGTDEDCCSVGGTYEYEIKDTEIRMTELRYVLSLFDDTV